MISKLAGSPAFSSVFVLYSRSAARPRFCSAMSPTSQPPSSTGEPGKNAKANGNGANGAGKKELKILMLHGYTQSGQLFKTKTGALSKPLAKFLGMPPVSAAPSLIYPTGPHRLRPSDIPGYVPSSSSSKEDGGEEEEETDSWAWFRRDEATGTYRGLAEGMRRVAEAIREVGGGVDGVVGFSQGGAMAGLVAAAMEPGRALPAGSNDDSTDMVEWATALREANGGEGLKFAVIYSGFVARDASLAWLYEGSISTPTLHFLGGLDTVVEESRSLGLVERCAGAKKVVHPGGHYVPVSKEWVGVLVGFIRDMLSQLGDGKEETAEE